MKRTPAFRLFRACWVSALTAVGLAPALACAAPFVGSSADATNPRQLLVITDEETLEPLRFREFSGNIVRSEPSPTGRFVGATVVDPASIQQGLFSFILHVLDPQGRTVATSTQAQAFEFSPDDRYVAVIKGRPYEGAGGFLPEATEIIDLQTQDRWTVPELEAATEVDWTNLPDGGLTLMARLPAEPQKIWKYRLSNRTCEATSWKGIHFSPDGRYYYLTPKEAIEAGLCRPGTKGDSCLRAYSWRNEAIELNFEGRFRRLVGWSSRSGHRLVVTAAANGEAIDTEINLATGEVRKLEERIDPRWNVRRGLRITKQPSGQLRLWLNPKPPQDPR